MKLFVYLALIASVSAYDESEGPTKEDNGEADPSVVYRESDIKNGEKKSGWTNPLGWTDDGAADDTVLLALNKHQQRQYKNFEDEVQEDDDQDVMKFGDFVQLHRQKQDNYDLDSNTVSQYDEMHQFKKADWGLPPKFEGLMRKKSDNYDGDSNTVSQYDDMKQFPKKVPSGNEELAQKHHSKNDRFDRDEETVSPYDDGSKMEKYDYGVPAGKIGHWKPEALSQKHHKKTNHKAKGDRFDRDEETVSPYDEGSKMEKYDYGVPAGQIGHWKPEALTQKHHKKSHKTQGKDEYDGDTNSASEYDSMDHHKHGDWGVPKGEHGAYKVPALTQKARHHSHHRK